MKCPYCDSEIQNGVPICPHCMAELQTNVKVVRINTSGFNTPQVGEQQIEEEQEEVKNKKSYAKYFIIMGILVVILIVLLIVIITKIKPAEKSLEENKSTTTTEVIEKELTLNKGVFSGKENPVSFGSMTIASINDDSENITKLVDVMITRYLTEDEVLEVLASNPLTLNDGFAFVGIEYNVYFHDLSYLGTRTLSPVLKVSILENKFFNDFFLVNGHYIKSEVVSTYNGINIKNEESATVRAVYQVPIGQNYYICFGSDSSSLGCFSN